MTSIVLPGRGRYTLPEPADLPAPQRPLRSRTIFAASHVVADPMADNGPGRSAQLDWEATLAFRRHLWSQGLGVAEAMDTAQRGMGLDWPATCELIRRSADAADGQPIACGVGTDQLSAPASIAEILTAYREQLDEVSRVDATPILMCSRALAAAATGPDDYFQVYDKLLNEVDRPAILHWLGPMFDPALEGYWGTSDTARAADHLIDLITAHADRVDGVKISLLDAEAEIAFRRRLPESVVCYTGDDFNYPRLIAGDERGFSHALLGVFDPLAPFASAAVAALDAGDVARFHAILDPTVALARKIFETPTFHYKTGVVFLAWLAGHQDHFRMVGGLENARAIPHLVEVFTLAADIGLFSDPSRAAERMQALLKVAGQ